MSTEGVLGAVAELDKLLTECIAVGSIRLKELVAMNRIVYEKKEEGTYTHRAIDREREREGERRRESVGLKPELRNE